MKRYLSIFLLSAVLAGAGATQFYGLTRDDLKILRNLVFAKDQDVLFGNSIIKATGYCDTDRSSIVDMLNTAQHSNLIDASRGGMRLSTMMRLVELLSLFKINPKTVVLPVSVESNFYLNLNERFGPEAYFSDNFFKHEKLEKNLPENKILSFNSKHYGLYSDFSSKEFVREKQARICPETAGTDPDFNRFMYYRNFASKQYSSVGLDVFRQKLDALKAKGVKVYIVILPINFEDIEALLGRDERINTQQSVERIVSDLSSYNVINLSNSLQASYFTDRWCACGHLNQFGRRHVANELGKHLYH